MLNVDNSKQPSVHDRRLSGGSVGGLYYAFTYYNKTVRGVCARIKCAYNIVYNYCMVGRRLRTQSYCARCSLFVCTVHRNLYK